MAKPLGPLGEPRADHVKYLHSWLSVLRDDKRAIFSAFSKAQAAADFVLEPPQPARPAMLSSGPDEPAGRCAEMK